MRYHLVKSGQPLAAQALVGWQQRTEAGYPERPQEKEEIPRAAETVRGTHILLRLVHYYRKAALILAPPPPEKRFLLHGSKHFFDLME